MKVSFGDLPLDAQAMLTRHLRIDFTPCDFKAPRWFSAWARNDAGEITGIFAIEFPFWFHGKITILVLDPKCITRRILRAIFTAAFAQAKRLTAEVEPGNLRALRQVQRLGFSFEGYCPLGLEGTRDTIVFGMLKEECPFLPGYVGPRHSSSDIPDRSDADAKTRRERAQRLFGVADFPHLFGHQLGVCDAPDVSSPVLDLISHVFPTSFPFEMPPIKAGRVSADMCSIGFSGRR